MAADSQSAPAIAPTADGFLVVWDDWRDEFLSIYGALVGTNASVSPTNGVLLEEAPDSQFYTPAIVKAGSEYLLLWEGGLYYGGDHGILGRRLSSTAVPLTTNRMIVSLGYNGQSAPDAAFNGTDYLAVWMDNRNA